MEKDYKYWEAFFQGIQMKYYSLLAAPLFIFALFFLRAENGNDKFFRLRADQEDWLVIACTILAVVVMLMSYLYTRSRFRKIPKDAEVYLKMKTYKKVVLTKYSLLAVVQLVVVIAFGITYHNALMGVFTALLLYSSFFRPEIASARSSLRMTKDEFNKIDYKKNL